MDRLAQIRNLLVMAAADGSLTEREIDFLMDRCKQWSIPDHEFAEAIRYAISAEAQFSIPESLADRQTMLRDLLRMMAADGELAEVEKRLFATAAVKMGLSDEDLQRLVDSVVK